MDISILVSVCNKSSNNNDCKAQQLQNMVCTHAMQRKKNGECNERTFITVSTYIFL